MNERSLDAIPALLHTIEVVLACDARMPDRFTPPATFPDPTRDIRTGLSIMRDDTARRAVETLPAADIQQPALRYRAPPQPAISLVAIVAFVLHIMGY